MSCQQAPRPTEDPYVFTETTSSVTVYNPQVHKLTSIKSSSTAAQKQFLTQKSLTQNRITQRQIQQQQQLLTRVNGGIPQIVNGFPKNAGTQNIDSFQKQFQIQCQQQAKLVNPTNSKKFLSPQLSGTHSIHSTSKQNTVSSVSPILPTSSLSPHYQNASLASPQSNILPQLEHNNFPQRNHSNLSKPIQGASVRNSQKFLGAPLPTGYQQSPLITSSPTINTIPKKVTQTKATRLKNEFKRNATEVSKQKSVNNDKVVFLTPSKRDSKVLSYSTRKTLKNQPSPNSRTKRSYSQIAHHEALQRIPSVSSTSSVHEWHAPDSYIFDNVSPFSSYLNSENCEDYDTASCVQLNWLNVADIIRFIPIPTSITREQRIELRKAQLRRQAMQNILAQQFRNNINAKRRFMCVSNALRKFESKDRDEAPPPKKCRFPTCSNNTLPLTAYCYLHITRNSDQFLFLPCTAKFSDNSQCRIPVFDITHELPLCREHAWKRDNYNRILQEQKPKKSRKRPRSISSSRPQKRKQKRRKTINTSDNNVLESLTTHKMTYQMKSNPELNYISSQATPILNENPLTQDSMLTVCENSSAYESSEDTGVGGLSESELMVGAHDVIEEIPLSDTRLLEEHDLTNVLNQLPVDAFNELFTTVQQNGPLEPTQEEQEDLERALEAVNKQVKSLQQLTGGDSAFLGDFLDVDDQMLDDTDICTEVVLNSPDTSGIDTSNILIDGNSNSGGCHSTPSDIRELVQT